MGNKKIIMLGHKALSGKDTFFNFSKELNLGYKRTAFADKLKETVADLYQLSYEQVHGSLKDIEDTRYPNLYDKPEVDSSYLGVQGIVNNNKNPEYMSYLTPRRIMQIFGQQMRALYPDIWVDYVFNVTIPKVDSEKIIITDFRFKNEAVFAERWCKQRNAELIYIKINRPTIKQTSRDISENDLNDFTRWSYILSNDSDLEAYKYKVIDLIKTI